MPRKRCGCRFPGPTEQAEKPSTRQASLHIRFRRARMQIGWNPRTTQTARNPHASYSIRPQLREAIALVAAGLMMIAVPRAAHAQDTPQVTEIDLDGGKNENAVEGIFLRPNTPINLGFDLRNRMQDPLRDVTVKIVHMLKGEERTLRKASSRKSRRPPTTARGSACSSSRRSRGAPKNWNCRRRRSRSRFMSRHGSPRISPPSSESSNWWCANRVVFEGDGKIRSTQQAACGGRQISEQGRPVRPA